MVWTDTTIREKDVIERCPDCDGHGAVLVNPGGISGQCWATPHGFPDDREMACERCSGTGWKYSRSLYHPLDDFESVEEFLSEWEWNEKSNGFVSIKDRKEVEDLW